MLSRVIPVITNKNKNLLESSSRPIIEFELGDPFIKVPQGVGVASCGRCGNR